MRFYRHPQLREVQTLVAYSTTTAQLQQRKLFPELPQEVEECTGKQISWYLFELSLSTLPPTCYRIWRTTCAVLFWVFKNTEVRVALALFTEQIYRCFSCIQAQTARFSHMHLMICTKSPLYNSTACFF